MTEPAPPAPTPPDAPTSSLGHPSTTPGSPVDDQRANPPAPAATEHDSGTATTEAAREGQETIRSISRLEESN